MSMEFSLYGLHRGSSIEPAVLARRARMAEQAGFDALWVGDHIALPAGVGDDDDRLEAISALTFLAAVTERVRLAVGVLVMPQRQPVLLAKQLTSVDVLSGGRLTIGVGVGYVEAELTALGASLADRGARTDEHLAAMIELWSGQTASFHGSWVQFADVVERPQPVQRPHPPIVVGGHSSAAMQRAIRTGGWFGWNVDVDETAQLVQQLGRLQSQVERPDHLGRVEVTIRPKGAVDLDTVRRFADVGVDRLVLQPTDSHGAEIEQVIAQAGNDLIGQG
jgi:probable F420-dependent oxidoreductase